MTESKPEEGRIQDHAPIEKMEARAPSSIDLRRYTLPEIFSFLSHLSVGTYLLLGSIVLTIFSLGFGMAELRREILPNSYVDQVPKANGDIEQHDKEITMLRRQKDELFNQIKEKDTAIGIFEVRDKQKDVVIEKLASRLKQFVDPTGLQLLEYGFEALSCTAAIDASELALQYRGKQEVALVCGFNDGTMDRHKDDRITIGPLYTPQKSIVVKVPFSKKMSDAIEKALLAQEKRLAPPKGSSIQSSFSVWFRLVLLPKGTDLATIHSLGDIVDRGGVVSPFEVTNGQSLLRPAKEEFSSYHRSRSS
jgi:hypothetical protein